MYCICSQAMIPLIAGSATNMLDSWERSIYSGMNEIEVSEQFDIMSGDIIARTTFGSIYEDEKHILNMHSEQMRFSVEAFEKSNLPFNR